MIEQVVLHTIQAGSSSTCTDYVRQGVAQPFHLVVAPGDPSCADLAANLSAALAAELRLLLGPPSTASCGGLIHPPAMGIGTLLVLLGRGRTPLNAPAGAWGPRVETMVILPKLARRRVSSLLPGGLSKSLAGFWSSTITEVVPAILATAGITPRRPRIFISYRRQETLGLANQLFHKLSERQFDVFLDQFTLSPGLDLRSRIRQELADKTMVVVLESPQVLQSRWIRYEIGVAQALRLGVFAIQVPGGTPVSGIGSSRRIGLSGVDFRRGSYHRAGYLTPASLDRVVDRLRTLHDHAAVERRRQLTDSMINALLLEGVHSLDLDAMGRIRMIPNASTPPGYLVWLASRSPELQDFYRAALNASGPSTSVVIGIQRAMESQRREQAQWLSQVSGVHFRDEGRLLDTAREMVNGTL